MRAGERVETLELIDDRGSGLDGRFLGKGGACPSEGTVLNEGSNTVGDMTGQAKVGSRVLLAMGGGLARRLPKLGAYEIQPVLASARDSDGLSGSVVTTTSGWSA